MSFRSHARDALHQMTDAWASIRQEATQVLLAQGIVSVAGHHIPPADTERFTAAKLVALDLSLLGKA